MATPPTEIRFARRCSCWVGCALEPRPCLYCAGEGCPLCEDGETLACPRCYLVAESLLTAGREWDTTHGIYRCRRRGHALSIPDESVHPGVTICFECALLDAPDPTKA